MQVIDVTVTYKDGDLTCTVLCVQPSVWADVQQLIAHWVNLRSYGREVRPFDSQLDDNGKGVIIFGDHLFGECSGPEWAPRCDELQLVPGHGYFLLADTLSEVSDEELEAFVLFKQIHSGKMWRDVTFKLTIGTCSNCKFLLKGVCFMHHEPKESCDVWKLAQRAIGTLSQPPTR